MSNTIEYTITTIDNAHPDAGWEKELIERLNTYGKEGWELAGIHSLPFLGSSRYSLIGISQKTVLILQRHKPEGCAE